MEKRILFLALIVVKLSAYGQLERGRSMIGGSIGFSQTNFNSNDTTQGRVAGSGKGINYNINVNYAYFVKDNLAVGVSGNIAHTDYKSDNIGATGYYSFNRYYTENYGVSLLARYYKYLYKNKLAFFASFNAGYSAGNGNQFNQNGYYGVVNNSYSSTTKTIGGNIRIQPGLVYFINRVIAIEANFGGITYNIQRVKTYRSGILLNTSDYGNFNSNINLSLSSLSLGFNFYFGKPKPAKESK